MGLDARTVPRLSKGVLTTCYLEDVVASETLENLSQEDRQFPPSPEFTAQANGQVSLYDEAATDFEGFWADKARSYLTWSKDFDQTLDWSDAPFAKWFLGGELNASYNCVDRHVEAGRGEVPVGAVVTDGRGRVLARAGNRTEELRDASAHAEMLALRAAPAAQNQPPRFQSGVEVMTPSTSWSWTATAGPS